ncbi:unnamed protein product [Strongylus vulgaris]|uniref:Uncharacterized protein n=1 Tax=Strongylus vulgaris TaxID=40348 RepID=A0A3P7JEX3_STRVU|nr:unnamed protein product [Strongylus vulgaris]
MLHEQINSPKHSPRAALVVSRSHFSDNIAVVKITPNSAIEAPVKSSRTAPLCSAVVIDFRLAASQAQPFLPLMGGASSNDGMKADGGQE